MSTFLINTFERKTRHRRRQALSFSSMINLDTNDENLRDKARRNNRLKDLISNPSSIGSTISTLLRRNKKKLSDNERCNDHRSSLEKVKGLSSSLTGFFRGKKRGLKSVEGKDVTNSEKTSEDGKRKRGKMVKFSLKGKNLCRMRSVSTINRSVEVKTGLRIKGITRMKSREKGEKRFELCKKKILMGEKCRPLNGNLRYDKHGVLIPEELV